MDTTKINFFVHSTTTPAAGFAFTEVITFSHLTSSHVDVGLDTTDVAPGSYDVWLGTGAVTDVYGVSSQPKTSESQDGRRRCASHFSESSHSRTGWTRLRTAASFTPAKMVSGPQSRL